MENENFSEAESLKLINEMIGKAKKSYITKGIAPIVWGSIITFCSMVTWARFTFDFKFPFDVWLLTAIALIPQIYFSIKEGSQKQFKSYVENTAKFVWTAFTICIFLLVLYTNVHIDIKDTSCLFMMLYGVPTFITGGTNGFKPMIIGGFFCWVAATISLFTPFNIDCILMAACGLFAWLIPGLILWNRYKKLTAQSV